MVQQITDKYKSNPNYCEISNSCGPFKHSYKGCKPFKDQMKSGLAFSFTVLIIFGGCCCIYRKFNKDKSKSTQPEDYNDEQPTNPPSEAKTLNEICSETSDDTKSSELSGELLDKSDSLVIYSSPKEGKSTLTMGMCVDIASGNKTKLLPESEVQSKPKPTRVIYYDSESSEKDLRNRYAKAGYNYPDKLSIVSGTFASADLLFDDIDKRVGEHCSDVVVCLDNLANIIPKDTPAEIKKIFARQKKLKNKAETNGVSVTFIIITHSQKTAPGKFNENIKGPSQLLGLSTKCIELLPSDLGQEYKTIKVQMSRYRANGGKSWTVKRVEAPYPHFEYYDMTHVEDVPPVQNSNMSGSVTSYKHKSPECSKCPSSRNKDIQPSKQGRQKPKSQIRKRTYVNVTPDMQERIIELCAQGYGASAIGRDLGPCRKTITRWIEKLKSEGRLKG